MSGNKNYADRFIRLPSRDEYEELARGHILVNTIDM